MVIDTPGYGFVYAPAHLKAKWKNMIFKYLGFGVRINMIMFLVNAQFGLKASDIKMIEDLKYFKKPVQVVLTKIDRVKSQEQLIKVTTETGNFIQKYNYIFPEVHLTSAKKDFGLKELRAKVAIAFEELKLI